MDMVDYLLVRGYGIVSHVASHLALDFAAGGGCLWEISTVLDAFACSGERERSRVSNMILEYNIPSGNDSHSYGKSLFRVDFSIEHSDFP